MSFVIHYTRANVVRYVRTYCIRLTTDKTQQKFPAFNPYLIWKCKNVINIPVSPYDLSFTNFNVAANPKI